MTDAHRTVGERFAEAGLAEDRFVTVKDGAKMCVDHDSRWSDPAAVRGTNYGVYADEDDQLFVLDVDVHRNEEGGTNIAVAALSRLEHGLRFQSPHVSEQSPGGHRLYKLKGDRTPAELFNDAFGKANPVPSWGEVIAKNKYIVGAGSQLEECSKEWCDTCATAAGGRYEIESDKPIPAVEPAAVVEALAADDDLTRIDQDSELSDHGGAGGSGASHEPPRRRKSSGESSSDTDEYDDLTREQVEALLEEIPGDQKFPEWIRTGYAVLAWDDGEEGREVFEEWSKENEDWEESESRRQIEYIWNQGSASGDARENAGVGTLVHIAREEGDPDVFDGATREAKSIDELIAEHSDEYESPEEVPEDVVEAIGPGDGPPSWQEIRGQYERAQQHPEVSKGVARECARKRLEHDYNWMYVRESERLWVYDDASGTFNEWGEEKIGQTLRSELGAHYARSERAEVVEGICDGNQVSRELLNARTFDAPLLCVGNGVINLETGELSEHDPDYCFVRGLEWDYPAASNEAAADAERVLEFLDSVTERPEDRDTLLDHLAHGLMPGHPYRAFVVCYGPGGNGKTQVARLFRAFVGEHNAASVEIDELVNDDFATGDLPGKFINWGDDMSGDGGGTLQELSTLKKASGGSEIRANEKYEKTYDFENEAAMFFSANEPPRIGEEKKSIKDRLYPIKMPYRFVEKPDEEAPMERQKVPNIAEDLIADETVMRGLLKLTVEHAGELSDRNGEYSQPENPEERWQRYNAEADPLLRFASVAVESADGDMKIRKDDLYRVYSSFMDSWSERSASERGFKRQFPRAVAGSLETAQSRVLANKDDEDERVRCWKRVTWREKAREHMPSWLVERYANHFEDPQPAAEEIQDADSGDEAASEDAEAIGALACQRAATFTATVASVDDGEYNREAQGTLEDDVGTVLGVVVPGNNENQLEGKQGKVCKFENVTIRTDDDGLKEAVVNDASSVARVDGAAQAASERATDGGTTAGGETDDTDVSPRREAAEDVEDAVGQVREYLRLQVDHNEKVSRAKVAGHTGLQPATVGAALERLLEDGTLQRRPDGDLMKTT